MEEMDLNNEDLVIPEDVDDDAYGMEMEGDEEGEGELDEGRFGEGQGEEDVDAENDIFGLARENQEMKAPTIANQEMFEKMDKIEDEMMEGRGWQMKGEARCKDRNYNSLLEEVLDFDTA